MSFTEPGNGYTIYSKTGCPYCVKAKELLESVVVNCDDYLKSRTEFLEFMDEKTGGYRMFPMIFYDGEFIGGYNEAATHLKKN